MSIMIVVLLFVSSIVGGRFSNPIDWIMSMVMVLPAILIGLSFHEFAHAYAAYKLGDMTPKLQGRVTINPAAHLDPIGFVSLLLIGFGWGVPVQIDPRNFKNRKRDELIVSFAGVAMNFVVAVVFMAILRLLIGVAPAFMYGEMGQILVEVIRDIITINLVLMVFNLIPVPPLDGFNIITLLFNLRNSELYYKIYQNGFVILLVLILFGVTGKILTPMVYFFYNLLLSIFF